MDRKVALIIERAEVNLGGAERSAFELSSALRSIGLGVDILAATGITNAKNVTILCNSSSTERTPYYVFEQAVKQYLVENKYDLVHSFLPFSFADIYHPRGGSFTEAILQNAASYQNNFVVFLKRATAWSNRRRSILLNAEKQLCKTSTGPIVVALSNYVSSQFKNHYGLCDERLVVIRNGVQSQQDIEQGLIYKLQSKIMSQLGLKEADNPIFFLFAANNFRLKGLKTLIHAMQMSAGHKGSQRGYLLVVGLNKANKYRHLARKLNVHKKILFLGPVRNIRNILEMSHVAVLPTYYDPSSRFILEALAADKPVITTKFNGATDLFTNNRHGKVIDIPENIPALAEALSYFTDTGNIQKAGAAIIKDNIRQEVSIARVARQINELYEQIVEKRSNKWN